MTGRGRGFPLRAPVAAFAAAATLLAVAGVLALGDARAEPTRRADAPASATVSPDAGATIAAHASTMAQARAQAEAQPQAAGRAPGATATKAASDSADPMVRRGAYLAKAGDCAGCHTAPKGGKPFAGGLGMASPFGTIYTANITPDPVTGIGRYSFEDFDKALRDGVAPGGKRLYPAMPYASYTKLTDADLHALYTYFMHGVEPVNYRPPVTKLPFPFSWRPGLFFWDVLFVRHDRFKPSAAHDAQWNRGAYLVQSLGHCGACHTPRGPAYEERGYDESSSLFLTGATNDHWFAPNLTGDPASGLGRMREDEIADFLHGGHGGRTATFGSMVQVVEDSMQYMSDDDLRAIGHYLKSLPPRKPYGAFEPGSKAAVQSVAGVRTGETERPGAGLYLSFCARCHQADGSGKPGKYPALAGNPAVIAPEATSLIRLLVEGGNSPSTVSGPKREKMPSFAPHFTNVEMAQVLTFIRGTWGNAARPVSVREVAKLRDAIHK